MTEESFWDALEYRICRELTRMDEGRQGGPWCDGVYPLHYVLGAPAPLIAGDTWIGLSMYSQEKWTFAFFLPRKYESQADIDWQELFPPENLTGWLALDSGDKHLRIIPSAAVPDVA